MHLHILPVHQKLFFNKDYCERLEGQNGVLMRIRILADHQKNVLKKDIFDRLEWLKTCFDAFAHTSRPPKSFFQNRCF
jgi:hypothetical protein